jgi:hypothetical protein
MTKQWLVRIDDVVELAKRKASGEFKPGGM